jgi:hypothetical protein
MIDLISFFCAILILLWAVIACVVFYAPGLFSDSYLVSNRRNFTTLPLGQKEIQCVI